MPAVPAVTIGVPWVNVSSSRRLARAFRKSITKAAAVMMQVASVVCSSTFPLNLGGYDSRIGFLQLILQFKIFDHVYLLTLEDHIFNAGHPPLRLNRQAFPANRGGYGAAIALSLRIISRRLLLVQFRWWRASRARPMRNQLVSVLLLCTYSPQ